MMMGSSTGDIWSTGAFSFESPLKDLLDSGDYTLEQLLAEDELLQEIRGVHPKLMEYFTRPEVLTKLIEYVILPPPPSTTASGQASSGEKVGPSSSISPAAAATAPAEGSPAQQEEEERELRNGIIGNEQEETENEKKDDIISQQVGDSDDKLVVDVDGPTTTDDDPKEWLKQTLSSDALNELSSSDNSEDYDVGLASASKNSQNVETHDLKYIRYPYMACEVICCDIESIVNLLIDGHVVRRGIEQEGEAETDVEGGENGGAGADADKGDAAVDSSAADDEEKEKGASPPQSSSLPREEDDGAAPQSTLPQQRPQPIRVDEIIFNDDGDNSNVELVNKQQSPSPKEDGGGWSAECEPTTQRSPIAAVSPKQEEGDDDRLRHTQQKQQPERILDLLFSLLDNTPPGQLDDYRAGYFEKILRILFRRQPEQMTQYMNTGGYLGRTGLIKCMLKHLYSHSIMLLAQRLLLPSRPIPIKQEQEQQSDNENDIIVDDEAAEHVDVAYNRGEGGGVISSGDQQQLDINVDEDDEEEEGIPEDEGEIKSDWSTSSEALALLFDCLINGGGEDVVDGSSSSIGGNESESKKQQQQVDDDERRLNLSIHASEVLITVIQNSLLSSQTMLDLTESATLERLIRAATTCTHTDSNGEEYFSPHESLLTTSMSVLESLILQLGGYGAVGTMSLLDSRHPTAEGGEEGEGEAEPDHLIADLGTLVEHLPLLLDNLSLLLRHPSTQTSPDWKTCTQYSKYEPVPIVGSSRLRIVRVLESLVLLGDPNVDDRLVQSDCLQVCLDLFWDFQWCSMLHQSVANLLVHVFEGQNARVDMQEYFLIRCNILVRLMDSFTEVAPYAPNARIAEVVMNMNDVNANNADRRSSTSTNTPPVLQVSEDDVEAAMEVVTATNSKEDEGEATVEEANTTNIDLSQVEQVSTEAVQFSSRDVSTTGTALGAPPQSFRFGYMGHVIIICQALVHATREEEQEEILEEDEEKQQQQQLNNNSDNEGGGGGEGGVGEGATVVSYTSGESRTSSQYSKEPLFLAEMVKYHPLSDKWNDFVNTTLANEASIQSTPLGGYNVPVATPGGIDPLHSHRPGLPDNDDDDDGSPLQPPSRDGILTGGDAIDMDDNDLEIAASMMASLNMSARSPAPPRRLGSDDSDDSSGDSNRSYNSGETNNSGGGYLFDDPLGKMNGGLGIALGNLTKYNPETDNAAGRGGGKGSGGDSSSDESSDHSSASSTEEEEKDRRESDVSDVPVMDLFAGNFDYDNQQQNDVSQQQREGDTAVGADWSDFANFDDAFATTTEEETVPAQPAAVPTTSGVEDIDDDDFGAFVEAKGQSAPDKSSAEIEEMFGGSSHSSGVLLLEDDDNDPFNDDNPFAIGPGFGVGVITPTTSNTADEDDSNKVNGDQEQQLPAGDSPETDDDKLGEVPEDSGPSAAVGITEEDEAKSSSIVENDQETSASQQQPTPPTEATSPPQKTETKGGGDDNGADINDPPSNSDAQQQPIPITTSSEEEGSERVEM